MSNREVAVEIKDLYKSFKLPHEQHSGIKQFLVNLTKSKRGYEVQHVLNGISFEIKKGEFFGIVGRNGSGKSTLLKTLAGIYAPDKGLVHVNGSLTPFIELGVGFNPELTGRENVYLNGALLGFSRNEMNDMYSDIVDFAELSNFMDQKLKNYSSGMQVRLAFSIAIRAKSDVLLLDEVLAVGDAAFQQKCYEYFVQLKNKKQTVILVTHDMDVVRKFCDRALLIKNGRIAEEGDPSKVSDKYIEENIQEIKEQRTYINKLDNEHELKINKISTLNKEGVHTSAFKVGDTMSIRCTFSGNGTLPSALNFGVALYDLQEAYLFGANTIIDKPNLDSILKKSEFTITYNSLPLRNGRYYIKVAMFGATDQDIYDIVSHGPEFRVISTKNEGMFTIEHTWR